MAKVVNDLSLLVKEYDLIFIDFYGVIYTGDSLFSGVLNFLKTCFEHNKIVFVISNSTRNELSLRNQLFFLGVGDGLYSGILTAGMNCFYHLNSRSLPFYKDLGNKFFRIGSLTGTEWILNKSSTYSEVASIEAADFSFISENIGAYVEMPESYIALLHDLKKRDLPMVCPNNDKKIKRGDDLFICHGEIAEAYRKIGGDVCEHGKPSVDMFECALRIVQERFERQFPKEKCLMIGDSLSTDIKGANDFGIDSLLCTNGLHRYDFANVDVERALGVLASTTRELPTFVTDELK
jgi:HAD superfamily hydrolase (TIGR01459 family)